MNEAPTFELLEVAPFVPPTLAHSGSTGIGPLKDRHPGETAWIVGKGPSLARLRYSDIGPGPVIAINDAISVVQDFGLPQAVYSMQKEGCEARDENGARPCGTCHREGWIRAPLVNPKPAVAFITSQYFGSWCLHGRPNRFVYPTDQFGYGDFPHTMSVLEAIPFARFMGCTELVLLCFDNMTPNGSWDGWHDDRLTDEQRETMRGNLDWVTPRLIDALGETPHRFVTP